MAAEHGGAMAVGGEARGGSTCARRRRKRERDLKEGEAELRARGIGEWRGGAGARRRRSCGRGEGRSFGFLLWRRGNAARAGVSERTGSSRSRRARGRGLRPRLPRGGRRRHMVATRRNVSAAVGAWTSGQQGNGAGLGRGERSAGWREQAGARGAGLGRARRGEARAGCSLGRLRLAGQKRGGGPLTENILLNFHFQ